MELKEGWAMKWPDARQWTNRAVWAYLWVNNLFGVRGQKYNRESAYTIYGVLPRRKDE